MIFAKIRYRTKINKYKKLPAIVYKKRELKIKIKIESAESGIVLLIPLNQ